MAIAKGLRAWAEQEDDYGHDLICLGDPQFTAFHVHRPRAGPPRMKARRATRAFGG